MANVRLGRLQASRSYVDIGRWVIALAYWTGAIDHLSRYSIEIGKYNNHRISRISQPGSRAIYTILFHKSSFIGLAESCRLRPDLGNYTRIYDLNCEILLTRLVDRIADLRVRIVRLAALSWK